MDIHDEFTNDIYLEIIWISIRDPLNIHRGDRGHMEVWRLYRPPMDVMFRVGLYGLLINITLKLTINILCAIYTYKSFLL